MGYHEPAVEPVTWESIQRVMDSLEALRPRLIVFYNEADADLVEETCRKLREQGHKIACKPHRFVEEGKMLVCNADLFQPLKFTFSDWKFPLSDWEWS